MSSIVSNDCHHAIQGARMQTMQIKYTKQNKNQSNETSHMVKRLQMNERQKKGKNKKKQTNNQQVEPLTISDLINLDRKSIELNHHKR